MSRSVSHDGNGALEIRFAFDRRLVDLVKTLPSRRWQASDRFWWAPEDDVVAVVELLEPHGFSFDEATTELYRANGGKRALPSAEPPSEPAPTGMRGLFDEPAAGSSAPAAAGPGTASPADFTVSGLNERVRDALGSAFPAPIWIVGEISGFNKGAHKRIVGFQLAERDDAGKVVSQVNATLFDDTRREIAAALARAGDPFRLEDEVTVRLRARVDLYVPWGAYRVVVEELDVNYTLGEAARRREEIVRRLTAEGLIERNRSLPLPELPLRVGVITSLDSDAYRDVTRTLEESGFAFRATVHGARVQGHATEPSVLNALDWFRRRAEEFDVVLICRGGGSRTDLAWFDSEALGRAVAGFPRPVVVGIGHEQDLSVLDAVARRCKTPTAAAGLLVEAVARSLERVERSAGRALELAAVAVREERQARADSALRLARSVRGLLSRESLALGHRRERFVRGTAHTVSGARRELRHRASAVPRAASSRLVRERVTLQGHSRQLVQGARRDVEAIRKRLDELTVAIGPAGRRRLAREAERAEARSRRLVLADPRRVVERGYAILRLGTGAVLTDPADAPAGAVVRAELRGGALGLTSRGADQDDTDQGKDAG